MVHEQNLELTHVNFQDCALLEDTASLFENVCNMAFQMQSFLRGYYYTVLTHVCIRVYINCSTFSPPKQVSKILYQQKFPHLQQYLECRDRAGSKWPPVLKLWGTALAIPQQNDKNLEIKPSLFYCQKCSQRSSNEYKS